MPYQIIIQLYTNSGSNNSKILEIIYSNNDYSDNSARNQDNDMSRIVKNNLDDIGFIFPGKGDRDTRIIG